MKLWLLDADIIIDLLGLGIFDDLVRKAHVFTSETVAGSDFLPKGEDRVRIDFKAAYVKTGEVTTDSATLDEINDVRNTLPDLRREGIDAGNLSRLPFCSENPRLRSEVVMRPQSGRYRSSDARKKEYRLSAC